MSRRNAFQGGSRGIGWMLALGCLLFLAGARASRAEEAGTASSSGASDEGRTRMGAHVFWGTGSASWDLSGFRTVDGDYDGDVSAKGLGVLFDRKGRGRYRYVSVLSLENRGDSRLDGDAGDPNTKDRSGWGVSSDHEFDFDVVHSPGFRLSLGPGLKAEVLRGELGGWVANGNTFEIRGDQSYTRVDLGGGAQVAAGFPLSPRCEMTLTLSYRLTRSVLVNLGAGPIDDAKIVDSVVALRAGFLFGATRHVSPRSAAQVLRRIGRSRVLNGDRGSYPSVHGAATRDVHDSA